VTHGEGNIHEPHDHPALEDRNDRVYCRYFHAGLRVYDISDPFVPREIACCIPAEPGKRVRPALHGVAGRSDPVRIRLHRQRTAKRRDGQLRRRQT
jgi:hypothetical protein